MKRPRLSVLVIGRGRLGRGLARALASAGVGVETWPGRGASRRALPDVHAVLLAVPDHAIGEVASRVGSRFVAGRRPVSILHASGALGPGALGLAPPGSCGVMHPLASVAGVPSPSFARTTFVIDGDRRAIAVARRLVRALGARALVRPLHGPRYHAAASLVANGAASLAASAVEILTGLGMSQREAERAIGGLLGTVAENVASLGVPAALTGPIVRGDARTVLLHRAALADDPRALAAYDAVAPLVLETARRAGLAERRATEIEKALTARRRTRAAPRA